MSLYLLTYASLVPLSFISYYCNFFFICLHPYHLIFLLLLSLSSTFSCSPCITSLLFICLLSLFHLPLSALHQSSSASSSWVLYLFHHIHRSLYCFLIAAPHSLGSLKHVSRPYASSIQCLLSPPSTLSPGPLSFRFTDPTHLGSVNCSTEPVAPKAVRGGTLFTMDLYCWLRTCEGSHSLFLPPAHIPPFLSLSLLSLSLSFPLYHLSLHLTLLLFFIFFFHLLLFFLPFSSSFFLPSSFFHPLSLFATVCSLS